MPVFISIKKSIVFLLFGLFCAAGTAFLINFFLSGPKLGPLYDFFLSRRPPPPVSREILIIDTDEFVESSDIFSVLMTLTELEASNLLLAARISGSSSPVTGTEAEIRLRFSDEYILLGANIRNLFEAIRSGSVSPSQAPLYVEHLLELTEQSRDRLLSGLIERDEDLIRSVAVFGNYLEVETKPVFDRDGKLRRVQPVEIESSMEHPVYRILKKRYAVSQIEDTEQGRILLLRGYDGNEWEIPLDRDGNIIAAGHGGGFRGINIELFREYEEAGRVMRRVLKEAGDIGAFSQTLPERSPLFLDDYAFDLRQELLKAPDNEKRLAWLAARTDFFKSMDEFLSGPAEVLLVSGYEEVIADENLLGEEGLAKLVNMRDEMIASFNAMRVQHSELLQFHNKLAEELSSSFCIMGPQGNTEYSALLANVLITRSHIRPANDRYALYWSIAAAFVILLILFRLQPAVQLIAGLCSGALAAAVFGWSFVLSAYWIEPVIVFGASVAGTLVIFCCKCAHLTGRARRFRSAYGAAVSPDILQKLIRSGRPQPSEITVSDAAVIAVKDVKLLPLEEYEKYNEAGNAQKRFFSAVKKIFFEAGAVITGYEKDTVFACFGSPLNNTGGSSGDPVNKAYALIKQLLSEGKPSWRFGMDIGECAFSWSPETGFTANGRPVVHAKVLVSRTTRFKTRMLVTNAVQKKIALVKK